MSDSIAPAPRPASVRVTVGTLGFLGLTALGGGIEMLLYPQGNQYVPIELIELVPIVDSFVLPGLVLALVFGVGSLVAMVGVLRRPHWRWLDGVERVTGHRWPWAATLALGVGFATWMAVEINWLGLPWEAEPDEQGFTYALYGIYVTVAILLLALPWAGGMREYLGGNRADARTEVPVSAGTG